MSNLFERLKTDLPHGWCSEQKAEMLAASVISMRPEITVSIGVWFGRSTSALALAHKEIGHGTVWAIDPWSKSASVEGQTGENLKWWDQVDHQVVYQSFSDSVVKLGIQNVTKILRQKSGDVTPPDNIGLVDADGNHGPQAVEDALRFGPLVKVGGLWVADDIGWPGGAVEKSLEVLRQIGFVELYRVDDDHNVWGVYQRIKD